MTNMTMPDRIFNLDKRLAQIEARFSDLGFDMRNLVQTEVKTNYNVPIQFEAINSLHTGICIDTIDPLKQGRVRFFSPLLHSYDSPVKSTHWAYPISNQGGFDDSGCTWVPPAGSKICVLFEAGNRDLAYYIGTTWDRDRTKKWDPLAVPEYERIHEGHRGGYLIGKNETEVFPPWNTENYNGIDVNSQLDFDRNPQSQDIITYPNIYGWKTPQKHMVKMVDGNYKCNFRWQRLEIKSAQGNHLIFKDDKVNPAPQWVHPDCDCGGGDVSKCNDSNGNPLENLNSCPTTPSTQVCANPYFKHESECRPYSGPKNPQNNKVDKTTLPQSGIQLTSLSGHTFWMDDSVRLPRGSNKWENSLESFDYGCPDDPTFTGKTSWKSAHGHQIYMSDSEPSNDPYGRNDENLIKILTATGNRIELNDDTNENICKAGPKRGITLQSTSNHKIEMIDNNNSQCNRERKEGGVPKNDATDAFIKIRSGYGLEIHMADNNSQRSTQQQFLQITSPQHDACAGAHKILMQEDPNCGFIYVRAGGDYICITEGDHFTAVGVGDSTPDDDFCKGGCLGPRNWFLAVSQHSIHYSCKFYYNKADSHAFFADKIILLLAGRDCKPTSGNNCSPCIGPVAVLINGKLKASNRVYASARPQDNNISITQLFPFVKPDPPQCDSGGSSLS